MHPKYVKSEELGTRITEMCAWLNAGEYRLLELIREFDQEGLWQLEGILSCAHWLNWKCGIGMNAAREKVRVANALPSLAKTSERYRRGEISYSKVRAITRIATPENEEYLLMIARHGTAAHVEGLVSKYRRCKRLQDQKTAIRQHALRELSCFYDENGFFNFRGKLSAETGALLTKALNLAIERAEVEAKAERRHLREAHDQDAGHWITVETPPDGDVDPKDLRYKRDPSQETRPSESYGARRADALARIAETYLAHAPKSSSSADRFQVVVHVSAETLVGVRHAGDRNPESDRVSAETPEPDSGNRHVSAETPETACCNGHVSAGTADLFATDFSYIEDGPHISAETVRRLACDASIFRVVDGENGEPLNIGRKSRLIPPALRRALRMRDDGCRFPGCTHKYFVDGHHIKHWADAGETSLDNLALLCRHHHRLVHEQGFGCERLPDGQIRFTNPLGLEIGRTGDAMRVPDGANPRDWLRRELDDDLQIGPRTGVTRWQGERIDWPLAVGHLFDKRRFRSRRDPQVTKGQPVGG